MNPAGLPFSAAVLAGGRSSRMGTDKAHLVHPTSGLSLLAHQFNTLTALRPRPVACMVSARHGQHLPALATGSVRLDDDGGAGPLGAIAGLLQHLTTPGLMIVPVDAPWLDGPTLHRLAAAFTDPARSIVASTSDGVQPLFAIYARRLAPAFATALVRGHLGLRRFLADAVIARSIEFISFDDPTPFTNWNTPDDWPQ